MEPRWCRLLLAGALALGAASADRHAAARLVFESDKHDFGEVWEGGNYPVEFRFKNEGDAPLRIKNLRPHCGCMYWFVDVDGQPYRFGDPILPGSSGVVKAVLPTTGYEGVIVNGVDVLANDRSLAPSKESPLLGEKPLKVRAKVLKVFDVEPSGGVASFGFVPPASASEKSIVLRSRIDEPFQILGFEPADAVLDFRAEPIDKRATAWEVRVRLEAGHSFGTLARRIGVRMHPERVPVSLNVVAQDEVRR